MSVSGVIAALNPAWDEELTPEEEDARFAAGGRARRRRSCERELAGAAGVRRGPAQLVARRDRAARRTRGSSSSTATCPGASRSSRGAPEALYVMYPKSDGWGAAGGAARARRVRQPQGPARRDWAGRSGAELAAVTGVPDAMFCHPARFYASAGSREGITALVAQALVA